MSTQSHAPPGSAEFAPHLQFKTKVLEPVEADESEADYIELKSEFHRSDCTLLPDEHRYCNSDLVPAVLNSAMREVTGGRPWFRLSELPAGVPVDTSGFLAIVRIQLLESFINR